MGVPDRGDRYLVAVIGLVELGHLLEDAKPEGADVVTVPPGDGVERRLADQARGATRDTLLCVVADTGDPAVNRLPARLARGGFRVLVLTGLPGADGTFAPHGDIAVLGAPFTADDVLVALSALPGDVPFFLPVEGGDRVFGDRGSPALPPAPPALEAVLFGDLDEVAGDAAAGDAAGGGGDGVEDTGDGAEDLGAEDTGDGVEAGPDGGGDGGRVDAFVGGPPPGPSTGPLPVPPPGPPAASFPVPPVGPPAASFPVPPAGPAAPLPVPPTGAAAPSLGPTDDDPLGPPVVGDGSPPRPASRPAWAQIGTPVDAPVVTAGPVPGWAAHPYAASSHDPAPPSVAYADQVLHHAPVIDGTPRLPAVVPAPRRRSEVLSICSYKGGSGKCLTGDAVITDPVTGLPRRLDALVGDLRVASVLTLGDGTIHAAPIAARVDSGVQPTVRVELRSGRSLTATPHHPLLLADGWRRVDRITPGEAVALPGRIPFPERPHRLAPSDLDLLATLVGGGRRPGCAPPATMPRAAFRLPEDQLERFIALVWMFDGKIAHDGPPEVPLASASLARSLQHLLLRFAVPSRVVPPGVPDDAGRTGAWRVVLHPEGLAAFLELVALRAGARYHAEVAAAVGAADSAGPAAPGTAGAGAGDPGTPDGAGLATEGDGGPPGGVLWDEVVSIAPAGDQQVWDLTVEPTHCFVANDVVVHNTTTAVLAAATLARAVGPSGRRVALVDTNTAQSSVSTILRRPARGSILDLVRTDVDEHVLAAALTPLADVAGLDVLFGAPDLRRADGRLLTPTLYRRIVATLRRTHDYVVVDTPVAEAVDHELFDDFVLRDSDRVLVVLDPNRETIHNNAEWLDIIGDPFSAGGRNVPAEKVGIVLNQAQDDVEWDGDAVSRQFRRYQFLGVVPRRAAVQQAANEGRLLERFDDEIDRAVRSVLAAAVDEPPLRTDEQERARSGLDRVLARLFRR